MDLHSQTNSVKDIQSGTVNVIVEIILKEPLPQPLPKPYEKEE